MSPLIAFLSTNPPILSILFFYARCNILFCFDVKSITFQYKCLNIDKPMKPYYLFFTIAALLVLIPSAEISAQQSSSDEQVNYRISGRVVEKGSGQPIAYAAAVLLEDGTGKNVTGGVADGNGEFFLTGFKEGNYKLQVSFMGYLTLEQNVTVTAGLTAVELGNLSLEEESLTLQEVTVQGQRDLIEERVDRTI